MKTKSYTYNQKETFDVCRIYNGERGLGRCDTHSTH